MTGTTETGTPTWEERGTGDEDGFHLERNSFKFWDSLILRYLTFQERLLILTRIKITYALPNVLRFVRPLIFYRLYFIVVKKKVTITLDNLIMTNP